MVFTAAGAFLKRFVLKKNNILVLGILHIVFAMIPLLQIMLMIWLRNAFVPAGAILEFSQIIVVCITVTFVFSALSGFLFVAYSNILSDIKKKSMTGQSYVIESLGGIIGGIIVSFVFIWFGFTFQHIMLIILVNLSMIIFVAAKNKSHILHGLGLAGLLSLVLMFFFYDFDKKYFAELFPGQKIVKLSQNPYGKIIITETDGQTNIYENTKLFWFDEDVIKNEESVHFPMLQHKSPQTVLVISGGLLGQYNEIKKYDNTTIDYLEINPGIIELIRSDSMFSDPGLRTIKSDVRSYLSDCKKSYDIVLLNVPEPQTLSQNRFYTTGFYEMLKTVMNDSSVLSLSYPAEQFYLSDESLKNHEVIFNTLKKVFRYVEIIPGVSSYFLASDKAIRSDISELYSRSPVENQYVTNLYLDDANTLNRQSQIYASFTDNGIINTDKMPVVYQNQINYWLSSVQGIRFNPILIISIAAGLFMLLFLFYKPDAAAMLVTSFTGTYVEISLILFIQIMFGTMYYMTGIVFTAFMTGLVAGGLAGSRMKIRNYQNLMVIFQLIVFAFSAGIYLMMRFIPLENQNWKSYLIILLLIFVAAFLVAFQFSLISKKRIEEVVKSASMNYSSDMAGGAMSAVISTVLLIPLYGFVNSALIVTAMNFLTLVYLFIRKKKLQN